MMSFQNVFDASMDRFLPRSCLKPANPVGLVKVVFGSLACFKATLSVCLGIGVVVFASIIKLPQIAKVVAAESAAGLSVPSLVIETFGYTYNLGAHYRQAYPIWTYGDFVMIFTQNLILLNLLSYYTKTTARGIAISTGMIVFTCASMFSPSIVPLPLLNALTSLNAVMPLLSRLPQIRTNARRKSTGQLSAVTCGGMLLGTLARVYTTIQSVPSASILAGYVVSAVCNAVLVGQIIVYRDSDGDLGKKAE